MARALDHSRRADPPPSRIRGKAECLPGRAGGLGGRLPASDLGSVYRNLEALERAGLVRHVHAGHGAGRYALATQCIGGGQGIATVLERA